MNNLTPINYIIIEGPDCSGKSTLYDMIHKESDYQWNIQDRSSLSMLVHAKFYGRDEFFHIAALKKELYNLNNQMIILLPQWEVIAKRFNSRGDDIQNIQSLMKLYKFFSEAVEEIQTLPNVTVIRAVVDESIVNRLVETYREIERHPMMNLSNSAKVLVASCNDDYKERLGINFTHYDFGTFSDINEVSLDYGKEREYYKKIKTDLFGKITEEIITNQVDNESRRFIYTDNSCISLAHFLVRGRDLDCKFFLRSSDVVDILQYDLNFLKYLSREVYRRFELSGYCKIDVVINSCHIPEAK
tara:strand:- start:155 stop:1057 length:903 start_codon:yes stop_codon:yes gene_type:complete